ncbi:Myosin type-2 heavy chain 1 [Allomyces arbusculus]|nr:Myosin type-2 heavy chain 1 [Allomyces arbusculus]
MTAPTDPVAAAEALLTAYTPGTKVWVQDAVEGWRVASVHSLVRSGDTVTVKVTDDLGKDVTTSTTIAKIAASKDSYELPPLKNPPMLEGIEDLTNLSYLHEPAVLHNIRTRYSQHNIYTYSGIVLIAMNPFQRVQLYTQDVVRAYSGKRRGELEPHLFAVAEDAFRGMIREKKNQSIIVSGESGAGKTVSAKYIMRYFAMADAGESGEDYFQAAEVTSPTNAAGMSEVEQQVLATNPIMESFGNAKTTRNDNSSRFGKYIELLFSQHAKIIGARIRTYLLERSRVIYQPETERNYHIFYQLVAGAPAAERKELGLQPHSYFHYLNQGGGSGTVPGVDDAAEFEITQRALSTIGVSVTVQWKLFRLLAALLHIGNIQITNLRNDEAYIADDDAAMAQTCKLLGVEVAEFKKWLVKKQIVTRFEKIVTNVNMVGAVAIRDSVAKFLYAGLFEWLVDKTNESLCPPEVANSYHSFIGVLDIYGFEHFKKNSFEQWCINWANEKLQQEFNQHVFKLEQEEYVKEQIKWSFIDFNDNKPCIELIEGRMGLLSLLDEESRLPSGSDKTLIAKFYNQFDKKHKFFGKPRFSNTSFIVHHFAHNVEYEIEGFIEKNKDTVPDELLALFNNAQFDFLHDVISAHKINKPSPVSSRATSPVMARSMGGGGKMSKPTLGSVFKQSLTQLMDTINATEVSYIRCIKSNSAKKPFEFEPQMVLSQLRACGVLETIRISTAGYPGRWTFVEFVERYYLLLPSKEWAQFKDIRGLCTKLLTRTIPDTDKYQIGMTKIFFRAGQLAYLEKLRTQRLNECVVMIQKNIKCALARKRYLKLRSAVISLQARVRGVHARKQARAIREAKAATVIQACFRRYLAQREFARTRSAVVTLQCAWRSYVARRELQRLREERAAIEIQAAFRGYRARMQYATARKRVILAQSCIRRYRARKELKALKLEAKSVNHYKEISYRLENKVVELTQSLDGKEKMVRQLNEVVKALEAQTKQWREKFEQAQSNQQQLKDKLQDAGSSSREMEAIMQQNKGLQSQLNAANDVIRSKDAEIAALQESLANFKATAQRQLRDRDQQQQQLLQQQEQLQQQQATEHQDRERERIAALARQEALIQESTQINVLKQEVIALKQQLEDEKAKHELATARPRRPSVDTLPPEALWRRQVTPLSQVSPTERMTSRGSFDALKRVRRHSSVEVWTEEMKAMVEVDPVNLLNGGHTPPRTVEEAIMEQEHTFSLLQDPKLESEILDGVIRNLPIPKHATQDASRRQIVFPAHILGLYSIKAWQHGMNSNMASFLKNATQAIEERVVASNFDDEVTNFWMSNLLELLSILKTSGLAGSASPGAAALAAARRTSIYMEGERLLNKTVVEVERAFTNLYFQWVRLVKKRMQKFIIPCVIENQSLPGFVAKDSSSLFRKFVSTQPTYTIEQLLDAIGQVWRVHKYYYVDDAIIRQTMSEIFKMVGVIAFNHLIMRKNFATWKRGMQIQYNVSRLTEWCSQHSLNEASLHLERLMQAAKLLQLNKATPTNLELYIEDLFDVCFLLSPTQISKLMSIYTVADFENPISPEILRAVASRSVSTDRSDVLLLEATPDTDNSWFSRPEPRKILGVEKYLPSDLEMDLPRVVLLFKFA